MEDEEAGEHGEENGLGWHEVGPSSGTGFSSSSSSGLALAPALAPA